MRIAVAMAAWLFAGCEVEPPAGSIPPDRAEPSPHGFVLPARDLRARLAIARRHAEADRTFGDRLDAAPAGVLLVEPHQETLFCHEGEAPDFIPLGRDPLVDCAVAARLPSGLPLGIKASFPAVGGRPTTVIGTPQATGESLGSWTLTLVHERLHAAQQSLPDYAQKTLALDLHGADETGAWMLDYAFPYDEPAVVEAATAAAQALRDALSALDTPLFRRKVRAYGEARAAWATASGAQNWRYAELQFWQEGVARYLELAVARSVPPGRDRAVDYVALAGNLETALFDELARFDPPSDRRAGFYPIGAGEALLLDALDPTWRDRYFVGAPAMGPRLMSALEGSSPAASSD